MPRARLLAEPEGRGRSTYRILEHLAESQGAYSRAALGKVDALSASLRAVRQGPEDLPSALTRVWQSASRRLEVMTEPERGQMVRHGHMIWTARRAVRRVLEHDCQHFLELSRRLDGTAG